ncbi:MAG TPA: hypothetical protein VFE05_20950, partial [Longimicrobiaceae bacterium]|nr:hypothetical protein [Longimicrobiaceae bacterium]
MGILQSPAVIASFGALVVEVGHWYELRHKLPAKNRSVVCRPEYWLITAVMILCSGIGTQLWYEGEPIFNARHYLIAGAAFPVLLKRTVGVFLAKK